MNIRGVSQQIARCRLFCVLLNTRSDPCFLTSLNSLKKRFYEINSSCGLPYVETCIRHSLSLYDVVIQWRSFGTFNALFISPPILTLIALASVALVPLHTLTPVAAAPSLDPAATGVPTVKSTQVNLGKTLFFRGWMVPATATSGTKARSSLRRESRRSRRSPATSQPAALPSRSASTPRFTLTLDGKPVATAAVKASDVEVTFNVDLTAIAEDWYLASITGLEQFVGGPRLRHLRAQGCSREAA